MKSRNQQQIEKDKHVENLVNYIERGAPLEEYRVENKIPGSTFSRYKTLAYKRFKERQELIKAEVFKLEVKNKLKEKEKQLFTALDLKIKLMDIIENDPNNYVKIKAISEYGKMIGAYEIQPKIETKQEIRFEFDILPEQKQLE